MKRDSPQDRRPKAVPQGAPSGPPTGGPACPHCGSTDVELEAPFGSTLMTRQYYCRSCRTPFEWVKWEEDTVDWLGP